MYKCSFLGDHFGCDKNYTVTKEDTVMKKNCTEIVFIIDRSGSMQGLEKDTIGGFNSMIEKQKQQEGEVLISTVLFNGQSFVLHDRVSLDEIALMSEEEYSVYGCTALLDALGSSIHHIGNVHKYARKEDVPEHTMFVIITDGMENASRYYSKERVKSMIEFEKEKYGWEFLFLGANMDAINTARQYGIDRDKAVNYDSDPVGTRLNYEAIDAAIKSVRTCGVVDKLWKSKIEKRK